MDPAVLSALAEPTRLRIVALLDAAPRPAGEVARELGLRQPQTSKHLRALERAGLVTVHPLGQRRIYALRREPLRELRAWLEGLERDHPSEALLEDYGRAVARESAAAERDPGWAVGRVLRLERLLPAPPQAVWAAWTSAERARRWWSPEHFAVAELEIEPAPGGALRIVMEESDGTRHAAVGRFLAVDRPRSLRFELSALAPGGGEPMLTTEHSVALAESRGGTRLRTAIRIVAVRPEAAPAVAGVRPGWEQLLDKLARELAG